MDTEHNGTIALMRRIGAFAYNSTNTSIDIEGEDRVEGVFGDVCDDIESINASYVR